MGLWELTQVEKLLFSRVRVMTHGSAMLRSWKNDVVSPTASHVLGALAM